MWQVKNRECRERCALVLSSLSHAIADWRWWSAYTVTLEHERFRPTGQGFISFSRPEYAYAALKNFKQAVVGGKTVQARAVDTPLVIPRSRGTKGVLEAARRGAITGNGPSGGVTGSGRNVVMYGLPGRLYAETLVDILRSFKLAGSEYGKEVIVKLEAK